MKASTMSTTVLISIPCPDNHHHRNDWLSPRQNLRKDSRYTQDNQSQIFPHSHRPPLRRRLVWTAPLRDMSLEILAALPVDACVKSVTNLDTLVVYAAIHNFAKAVQILYTRSTTMRNTPVEILMRNLNLRTRVHVRQSWLICYRSRSPYTYRHKIWWRGWD